MTILDSDWPGAADEGLLKLLGDPMLLFCESEGEPRASLEPPPPLLEAPPPPCDAVGTAAAEEAELGLPGGAIVLGLPDDSSWFEGGCCDPVLVGEKGEDDEKDEARLATCLLAKGCIAGKLVCEGEKALREGLADGAPELNAVDIGVSPRRPLCCCLDEPQENCWLI